MQTARTLTIKLVLTGESGTTNVKINDGTADISGAFGVLTAGDADENAVTVTVTGDTYIADGSLFDSDALLIIDTGKTLNCAGTLSLDSASATVGGTFVGTMSGTDAKLSIPNTSGTNVSVIGSFAEMTGNSNVDTVTLAGDLAVAGTARARLTSSAMRPTAMV
jgi:hypothetical protein